jgi:hypothetical protein
MHVHQLSIKFFIFHIFCPPIILTFICPFSIFINGNYFVEYYNILGIKIVILKFLFSKLNKKG